jgi:hypothetical protein
VHARALTRRTARRSAARQPGPLEGGAGRGASCPTSLRICSMTSSDVMTELSPARAALPPRGSGPPEAREGLIASSSPRQAEVCAMLRNGLRLNGAPMPRLFGPIQGTSAVSEEFSSVTHMPCATVSEEFSSVTHIPCATVSEEFSSVTHIPCVTVTEEFSSVTQWRYRTQPTSHPLLRRRRTQPTSHPSPAVVGPRYTRHKNSVKKPIGDTCKHPLVLLTVVRAAERRILRACLIGLPNELMELRREERTRSGRSGHVSWRRLIPPPLLRLSQRGA